VGRLTLRPPGLAPSRDSESLERRQPAPLERTVFFVHETK
jgi:hypothetical protein